MQSASLHAVAPALLPCAGRGCQGFDGRQVGFGVVLCWGCVGALGWWCVSADAQAYFGPRHGVATGRVHDVMGVPADEGAAAQSLWAVPPGGVGSRVAGAGRGSSG